MVLTNTSTKEKTIDAGVSPAMAYIVNRPNTAPVSSTIVIHDLPIASTSEIKAQFPTPEHLWSSRDVNHEDWNTFIQQLTMKTTNEKESTQMVLAENEAAHRRRVKYVVGEWNDEFFKPRGLRVQPHFLDTTEAALKHDKPKGFGFKAGKSFVGISLPPNSSGYGLRLPGGVLLGVSTSQQSDEKQSGGK